jgi:hypothetical protein
MRIIFFYFLLFYLNVNAQKILKEDILGATYSINNQEVIKKFQGKEFNYKNVLLGKLSNIDVVNPMQLILFYKSQNTIVILDNQLNAINTINFNKLENSVQVLYAALASQNQIWIFDANEKRIGLYNLLQHKIKYITNIISEDIDWFDSDLNNLYFLTNNQQLYEVNLYGKISLLSTFNDAVTISYFDKTFTVFNKNYSKEIQKFKLNKGKLLPLNE